MPDVDSVLLASLEVTNKTFSYNFKLRPEMGPTQAGEMFSILPNKVYGIVVIGGNYIIGLGLRVRSRGPH